MKRINIIRHYLKKIIYRKFLFSNRTLKTDYPATLSEKLPIDLLTDDDLEYLNGLLDWNTFSIDSLGRCFGGIAWSGKRTNPEKIPDDRIVLLDSRLNLADKRVLEVGCLEGHHTIGLCQFAEEVIAIDSRIENVVKTIIRCSMMNAKPKVLICDLEDESFDFTALQADVLHHVGVLYHLRDPVRHLFNIHKYITKGIMLDTHYAEESEATLEYQVDNISYPYKHYAEFGRKEIFSGMYDHAKWLRLSDIQGILKQTGFSCVDIIEKRMESNGPRVLLLAKKI